MIQNHDGLTGLKDRSALKKCLDEAVNSSDGVAIALLDLDNLQEINADLGSETGDRVLLTIAAFLKESFPDQSYRVSGDEFALVFPGGTLEEAFLKTEALRARMEAEQERFGPVEGRKITVTAGVAQCPRDAKEEAGLMRAADAALSSGKEGLRNRVALPPNEEMVMKSCYYAANSLRKLKALAERSGRKESVLLREALDDLLRKHDVP